MIGLEAYNFEYIKEYIDYTANVLLKLYLFYNIQDSLEFIYEVNRNLLKAYVSQIAE